VDATWVAAIASVASALVVGVTALAAFLQIRHVRYANELSVYMRLFDRLDTPNTLEAFRSIDALAARIRTDPEFRRRMAYERAVPEFDAVASLLQFFEHLSTLVALGNMSERLVLAEYAENIVDTWDRLSEAVYLRRISFSPNTYAAYEHLAMRARDYIAKGELQRLYDGLRRDPRMASFTPPAEP
jgi:hypothetical protein